MRREAAILIRVQEPLLTRRRVAKVFKVFYHDALLQSFTSSQAAHATILATRARLYIGHRKVFNFPAGEVTTSAPIS